MPPLYRMVEVCVYSLTNFLPFLAMALYPFRRRLRFSPAVAAALVAVLTLLQMGLGLCAAFFTPGRGSLLSAVSTGLYAVFYFLAVRAYPGKTLFTLLMISNLANLVVIAAKCLEGQLFPALAVQSYRWSFALMMRSGRIRSDDLIRSRMVICPAPEALALRVSRLTRFSMPSICSSAESSMVMTRSSLGM